MKPGPDQPGLPLQELEGTLERITFQNEENGYTVARLVPRGKTVEVTVIGGLSGVNVGESVRLHGLWVNNSQYGRQFEVRSYTVQLPATVEGLRKYLGSGLIRGVGPVTAKRIVDHFGLETLEVIEEAPHRLREIPGIGDKRTDVIRRAWEEQKQIKEIMVFLQGHGVNASLAVKIYKKYGDASIEVVRRDPYRLAKDIYGIGFKTADKIARQMGLAADAPVRIQAGLVYALGSLSDEGHCFAWRAQLIEEAARLLEVDRAACEGQVATMLAMQEIIADEEAIYLPPFLYAEQGVAGKLARMRAAGRDRLDVFQSIDWQEAYNWLDAQEAQGSGAIYLTDQQKDAIRIALTSKISILTGGPGTGKTTITRSLIRLLKRHGCSVLLAAPTGRAAKRLSEATGVEARTIHRLLEYNPVADSQFLRDQDNPLDADLVIIDETSMVDILLMNHLLSAIEQGSHFLLVGDVDQLPSVGAGNVLRDLIASRVIPVARLETIFRQAEDSYIVVNAHRINQGEMPLFAQNASDFFLFSEPDPQKAADWVLELVARRIPAKFGFDPQEDIQVLCPMHRGSAGVTELNQRLQETLNPPAEARPEFIHGSRTFRSGDRVMQVRNNYDRQVFNGDLGRVVEIDLEEKLVSVEFDGRRVGYEFSELDELVHAYAVSIHKSQGCEFPVVVIPLLTQHFRMLQRNLLYTGVTRARRLVVLVGNKKAIAIAVHNDRIAQRNTRLAQRLEAAFASDHFSGYYMRPRRIE